MCWGLIDLYKCLVCDLLLYGLAIAASPRYFWEISPPMPTPTPLNEVHTSCSVSPPASECSLQQLWPPFPSPKQACHHEGHLFKADSPLCLWSFQRSTVNFASPFFFFFPDEWSLFKTPLQDALALFRKTNWRQRKLSDFHHNDKEAHRAPDTRATQLGVWSSLGPNCSSFMYLGSDAEPTDSVGRGLVRVPDSSLVET